MTGQIPDSFIYNKISYSLVGFKGEGLLSPFEFGLEPVSPHTANWRGFVMTYTIAENHLFIKEMNVTVKNLMEEPPIINNVNPVTKREGITDLTYKDLMYKTQFTGKILIAKDFIDSMYVHMGFQSPISFKKVLEFEFTDGELISTLDLSEKIKKYRKKNISDGKLEPSDYLQAWIARTFSLDYDF